MSGIAARRLSAQRLAGQSLPTAVDAVRWLGAVQSQDFGGATWALGMRVANATEAAIARLYDDGAILRTHLMRPTWHFVVREDIRWLLDLTSPRLRAALQGRHRQLGLDAGTVGRANDVIAGSLAEGGHLTRRELGDGLERAGISTEGQRLAHLLMAAELEGVVASGRRRGRQMTYALLHERAPRARRLDREEAVAELALRYFRSHGPAQLQDFVWWSGLTVSDARAGIALAGAALTREDVDGVEHWFDAAAGTVPDVESLAHLLPNFDEYTVAYRHRGAVVHDERPIDPSLFSFGSVLSNVVTIGGRVAGSWRRTPVRGGVRVEVRQIGRLRAAERTAVDEAARAYGRFLERDVELRWGDSPPRTG